MVIIETYRGFSARLQYAIEIEDDFTARGKFILGSEEGYEIFTVLNNLHKIERAIKPVSHAFVDYLLPPWMDNMRKGCAGGSIGGHADRQI